MSNVVIELEGAQIPVDMVITDSDTYDIILGMNWLENAQAEIQIKESHMIIRSHGQEHEVPLNYTTSPKKIIYSSNEESSSDEETSAEPVYTITQTTKKQKENFDQDQQEEEIEEVKHLC
jgi:hypothetical protein